MKRVHLSALLLPIVTHHTASGPMPLSLETSMFALSGPDLQQKDI